jgi:hypothetical protein
MTHLMMNFHLYVNIFINDCNFEETEEPDKNKETEETDKNEETEEIEETVMITRYTKGKKGRKNKVGKKICRYAQFPDNEKAIMPNILTELLSARKATRQLIKYKTVETNDGMTISGLVNETETEYIVKNKTETRKFDKKMCPIFVIHIPIL